MKQWRTGFGYDAHRLISGRKLILGGVEIKSEKGLEGHSDADVLLHAICDALLGAAALGDIGSHFPDTSAAFRGISSVVLLEKAGILLKSDRFVIANVDATVVLERPKIAPYVAQMRTIIAAALGIDASQVSIKATTNEGLDSIGEGKSAVAHAVAMIYRD